VRASEEHIKFALQWGKVEEWRKGLGVNRNYIIISCSFQEMADANNVEGGRGGQGRRHKFEGGGSLHWKVGEGSIQ